MSATRGTSHSLAPEIQIAGHHIGPGRPCFVIAEAGVNHNGSLEMALRLVDAAADARADAVKFQTFKTGKVVSPFAPKAEYQARNTGEAETQWEMIQKLELPATAFQRVAEHCRARSILFLSTPFDSESADELERLGVPAFKIPSGEITNTPLLEHIARKHRPLIVSTGMADLDEVRAAVEVLVAAGNRELALLQCTSNYPASPASINLRAMRTLAGTFAAPAGFSDHSEGIEIALAAVALGACIVEKHFTLDRTLPGPDHRASLEPAQLAALVTGIRKVEAALGDGLKRPAAEERATAEVARRSLVAACDIPAGCAITAEMIAIVRPGTGLPPAMRERIVGRRVRAGIKAGTVLTLEMLS